MIYFFRPQPIRTPKKNLPSKGIRCIATHCGKAGAWGVFKTV